MDYDATRLKNSQQCDALCCMHFVVLNNECPWCSGNVMNCHATAPGSIPGRDGVFTELHVLRKGQ